MSNRRGKRTTTLPRRAPVVVTPDDRTRKPLAKQRSLWHLDKEATVELRRSAILAASGEIAGALEPDIVAYTRNVSDGRLDAYIGTIPSEGLHLSIAHKRPRAGRWEPGRYPTWDEIADARDALLPADRTFVMYLPKEGEYLAVHPTTFHLHELIPAGVVRGTDGSHWVVQPLVETEDRTKIAADDEGYPLCRLVPYAVDVVKHAEGGEGDVAAPPGTAPSGASSGPVADPVSPGPG